MKQKLNLFILFLILFIGQVNYVKADTIIRKGTISGTSIKWTLTSPNGARENLKLSFTGSGKIPDYPNSVSSPWEYYNSEITEVYVAPTITEIGDYTFFEAAFSFIDIPSSCTRIGEGAFYGCTNLKEIYIPESVVSIGPLAFNGCKNLSFIYFEGRCTANTGIAFSRVAAKGTLVEKSGTGDSYAQVPSGWNHSTHLASGTSTYIQNGTLYVVGKGTYITTSILYSSQINSIKRIVVEDGVTDICDYAFKDCANVTEVTLKNTGTIGIGAFKYCTALTRVNVGAGVKELRCSTSIMYPDMPFEFCDNLSIVNITNLDSYNRIANLGYLTDPMNGTPGGKTLMINGEEHDPNSELVIPEGWTEVNSVAFKYFKNVQKVKIPSSMKTISHSISNYITEITLPSTVTSVEDGAFAGCSALTTVTLNNRGTIGAGVFSGCKSLTRINIGASVTGFGVNTYLGAYAYKGSETFSGCSILSEVNVSSLASFLKIANLEYLTNYGAKEKTLMVNGNTHSSSNELVIPVGVTEIPNVAFRYFKNVTKIKLPSTMTKIAANNFKDHTYLTEVTLPSSVTSVESEAFRGCTALKTVTLNNSGTIGDCAFKGCTALTRVNIGTGLTGFASYLFSGCSSLSEVNVSNLASFCKIAGLEYLTDSYYGTAKEKTLMVNGNTHSSSSALVIPEGVTSISEYAFKYFKNVTQIKLPSTMTEIAYRNFYGHTYLKKITLPSRVTSVGSSAFSGCTNLERIVCKANTPPSATNSIASNPSEITLKVPSGKAATYKAANVWKEFNIEEVGTYNYSVTMRANESKQFVNNMLNKQGVSTRVTSNGSIASPTVSSNIVTIKAGNNPTYDGSTSNPCKLAVIRLYLEEGDVLTYGVTVAPREVELTDGNAYKNTKEFEVDKVSYTRTYAEKYANHLQCFYVPFDVEVTDELLEDFTFYKLYMVSQKDANGNGEIEEDEPLVMLLNKIPAGQVMKANMPYYIKPKAASTLTVTAENAKLYAAANGTVSCSTTENEYTLTGIYDKTNIKGHYTMAANGTFMHFSGDTNLGSYRWYMTVRDRMANGAEYANYARPIEIIIDGEDDTTGIVALEDKASASQNDKIYTLDGRQVTDFETLPSGIYIINGKKVFKK